MASLSEMFKEAKKINMDNYFGEGNWKKVSTKYFTFKRVLDEDNLIIVTNNVRIIKEKPVLLVDNNKAIYLKFSQIREIRNWELKIDAFLVKLNKDIFNNSKVYTFKNDFEDAYFETQETFENLMETAKEQEIRNIKVTIK